MPCDGSGALKHLCEEGLVGGEVLMIVPSSKVIEFLEIQGSVGFNVGMLLLMGIVPRYFAYLALKSKKEADR